MTETKEEGLKRPKYVAFSTQKGGAGKTTITVLVASYLHYVKDCNVAIIDCDYPQYSVSDLRKRDREKMLADEFYQAWHRRCSSVSARASIPSQRASQRMPSLWLSA